MENATLGGEPLGPLLDAAHAAADAAAAPCLARFRAVGLFAEDKGGASADAQGGYDPVTEADREAEAAIRAVLAERRPRDGVRGEEHPETAGEGDFLWTVDPVDGTRAFISGAPSWGVLVALAHRGRPAIGIIDQPFTGERFTGVVTEARRETLWRRGAASRRLTTRACERLEDATLFTTFPELGSEAERRAFERVRDRARLTRYGLDCYAYALLAHGLVDLVIEAGLKPWDVQALVPVVEGAGGVITDWRGGPCWEGGRVIAAGDARAHAAALELLAEA